MQIGIDIGGTFTDFILFDQETGEIDRFKTPSTPSDPAQAVLDGLEALNISNLVRVVHGSTVATNAVLERKGARTALLTTKGFKDILLIGRQNRRSIYDLSSDRPSPLVPQELSFEIDERINSKGETVTSLNMKELPEIIRQLKSKNVESVAVVLLFSFLNPEHEMLIAEALREAGLFVSASSEILPEFREYERASTTTINGYISPIMDRYLCGMKKSINIPNFRIMQSNGGTIDALISRKEAVRTILSGPAGGVVGAFDVAKKAGFDKIITFDMGGTSTDVSLCDGEIRVTSEGEIDGLPIRIPTIDIHTVGSGGGSVAFMDDGGALRVGPRSAGADPGPACYGRGGSEPTVTDANLLLGRLSPDHFLDGRMKLQMEAAEAAISSLSDQFSNLEDSVEIIQTQAIALGIIKIANSHMERAIRVISIERGHDPRDFTLVSFGGAGGLHACELARAMGIARVLIPQNASILSAYGMLAADVVKEYVQTVMLPGDGEYNSLERLFEPMIERGRTDVMEEGIKPELIQVQPELDMRYRGQSYELTIVLTPDFIDRFHDSHRTVYGYCNRERDVQIVNLRLRVTGKSAKPELPVQDKRVKTKTPAIFNKFWIVINDRMRTVLFYRWSDLRFGHEVDGAAIIIQKDTTVLLGEGDRAVVDRYSNLVIDVESV